MDAASPVRLWREGGPPRRAWVVSSWVTGATDGNILGEPGYSYDFLASLYVPLLRELGEVVRVSDPRAGLEPALREARARGLDPVHVAFFPPHYAPLSPSAPNVVVPAWEYAEIPDHEFDGNPQNDWVATSQRCALILTASAFTRDALLRAGVRCPVALVQAPVTDEYFELPAWRPGQRVILDCRAHVVTGAAPAAPEAGGAPLVLPSAPSPPPAPPPGWRSLVRRACRRVARAALPPRLYRAAAAAARAGLHEFRAARPQPPSAPGLPPPAPPTQALSDAVLGDTVGVELSGVVYTCIFNPADYRKNWEDLLNGYVHALRDCPDATLVVKLATRNPYWVEQIVGRFRGVGIPYRCKVVVIAQYLSDEQMRELARASTYYLTTTKAEGICLPLMDYLAAGRPAVSPRHTALEDYFGPEVGFVVDSHPEPAAFLHDRKLRALTTWRRLNFTSLMDQIRSSYAVARERPAQYAALADRARQTLRSWASTTAVRPRLAAALAALPAAPARAARAA